MSNENNQNPAVGVAGNPDSSASLIPTAPIVRDSVPNRSTETGLVIKEATRRDPVLVPAGKVETAQFTGADARQTFGADVLASSSGWFARPAGETSGNTTFFGNMLDSGYVPHSLMIKGTNLINPFAMTVNPRSYGAADSSKNFKFDTNAFENAMFQGNGASVTTRGTTKAASIETATARFKAFINNLYNRDIPLTDLGYGGTILALYAYHRDICKLRLPFEALATVKTIAKWYTDLGIGLDNSWNFVYSADLYTQLADSYKRIAELPVLDIQTLDKMSALVGVYAASERNAYPGSLIMQDTMIAELIDSFTYNNSSTDGYVTYIAPENLADSKTARAKGTVVTSSIWKDQPSLMGLIKLMSQNSTQQQVITQLAAAASSCARQYNLVIAGLYQMEGKNMIDKHRLSEWIPGQLNESGIYEVTADEVHYDYHFHERVEYAPRAYSAENSSGSNINVGVALNTLSNLNAGVPAASIEFQRPFGLCHGTAVFDTQECADIGVWREISNAQPQHALDTTNANTLLPLGPFNTTGWVVDAIDGFFYFDGLYTGAPEMTRSIVAVQSLMFGGANASGTGSGTQNLMPLPCYGAITRITGSGSVAKNRWAMYAVEGDSAIAFYGDGQFGGSTTYVDYTAMINMMLSLMEQFDMHYWLVVPQMAAGVTDTPITLKRIYKDTQWFSFNAVAINGAVANMYTSLFPEIRFNTRN